MIQRKISIAAAVLGLFGSTSAMALESGFYLGVVGAQASVDIDKSDLDPIITDPSTNFTSTLDDSDTSYGIVLGGQLGRWFAVETQFIDLGKLSYSASESGPLFPNGPRIDTRYSESVEAASAILSGSLTVPIGDHLAIGFRLGLAINAVEASYYYEERIGNSVYSESFDNDGEATDTGATYGVSVEWDPTTHFGVRLEYQRITNVGGEDDDFDFELDNDDEDDFSDDIEEQEGEDVDLVSLSLVWRF